MIKWLSANAARLQSQCHLYVDKFGIRYERTDKIENNLLLPGKMLKIKTGIVKV